MSRPGGGSGNRYETSLAYGDPWPDFLGIHAVLSAHVCLSLWWGPWSTLPRDNRAGRPPAKRIWDVDNTCDFSIRKCQTWETQMRVKAVETVELGTWVKVNGFVPGVPTVFHLVPEIQVNYQDHKVSPGDVLGRTLIGVKVGEKVTIDLGGDRLELTVLDLGPD